MASIHKINDQYRVRYFLYLPGGRKVDRSRRVDKMSQARELAAMANVLEGATRRQDHKREDLDLWRRHGLITSADLDLLRTYNDGRKTMRQAADEYLAAMECSDQERDSRESRVERLVEILGPDTQISTITYHDGERIKAELRGMTVKRNPNAEKTQKLKAASINKHLQDLKRIFTLQLAHRTIEYHPFGVLRGFRIPKAEKIKHNILTQEQIQQVLTAAEEQDKLARNDKKRGPVAFNGNLTLILLMFFGCGLRRSEALAARLENIDWEKRLLLLTETKTDEERTVGLGARLFRRLLPRKGEKGPILPQYSLAYLSRGIMKHFINCGFPMRLHDARHTYTTRLLDLGVNNHHAMGRTGHKDSRMLGHYTHPDSEQVFEDDFEFMR